MARTDTLTNWATDVANSIREKTGKTDPIPASEFDTEIAAIEAGSDTSIEDMLITRPTSFKEYSNNRVTVLGKSALRDTSIESVNLPLVTTINSSALYGCENLTSINVPLLKTIESYAFYSCESLITIDFPELEYIKDYAFYNCDALTTINAPSLKSIGEAAFRHCDLISLNLPSVTTIGKSAFFECYDMIELNLPEATNILESAFYLCSKLVTVNLAKATSIPNNCFYDCISLSNINIPNLKTINDSCFTSCNKLNNIHFDLVETIGEYSFQSCKGLETISFSSLKTIRDRAFRNCTSLKRLILSNNTVCTLNSTYVFQDSSISSGDGYIYVPDNLVDTYKSQTNWSTFANQIKSMNELHLTSIEIVGLNSINKYVSNNTNVECTYNGGFSDLYYEEEMGITWSVEGNATIDQNGTVTLTNDAQAGDILTITATSNHNTNIIATKNIEVVYIELSCSINLNNGQWIATDQNIDGHIVYQSDAGSYHTDNGTSTAIITVVGYMSFTLYIWSDGEGNYDYTEAFAIDTNAVRNKGSFTSKGTQTTPIKCTYELDGGEHTIQIMYSKDNSSNQGEDRGYFYIEGGV